MGSAPSPPAPTNPGKAAAAQSASDIATSGYNVVAQNPNEYGPTGSVKFDLAGYETYDAPLYDGKGNITGYESRDTPRYNRITELSPAEQAKYDLETNLMLSTGQIAQHQLGQASSALADPFRISDYAGDVGSNYPDWANLETQQGLTDYVTNPFQTANYVPEIGSYYPDFASINNQQVANADMPDYLSWDQIGDRSQVQNAMLSRLNPQLQARRDAEYNRLYNQGVRPGSAAWQEAEAALGQAENDAQVSAYLGAGQEMSRLAGLRNQKVGENAVSFEQAAGIRGEMDAQRGQALQEAMAERSLNANEINTWFNQAQQVRSELGANRQQQIQEGLLERTQPLNEISAAMSGNQVNMPQGPAFQAAPIPNVPIADYMYQSKAQQFQAYNAQLQAHQAKMSGMFGMIGGLAKLPFGGLM